MIYLSGNEDLIKFRIFKNAHLRSFGIQFFISERVIDIKFACRVGFLWQAMMLQTVRSVPE